MARDRGPSNPVFQPASLQSRRKGHESIAAATLINTPPRPNENNKEDYTELFLSHAQLYASADRYDIHPLKVSSLNQLQVTLEVYTLYPERTIDIITLWRQLYTHTGDSQEGVDNMKTMVIGFVKYHRGVLLGEDLFTAVLTTNASNGNGEMLRDFVRAVRHI